MDQDENQTLAQTIQTQREEIENLKAVLTELLRQIEACDGTAQLDIERAQSAVAGAEK